MEDKISLRLTAAEISALWTQYVNDTLAHCVTKYFLEHVEDEEIKPIVETANLTSIHHIKILEELFIRENFPIPKGFDESDVNPKAPRLFSDTFMMMYLRQMSILAMAASSGTLGLATRPDVITFFKLVLKDSISIQDKTRELMLSQGTYVKPPYISLPDKADFVKEQQFLVGFFGKKRSLTGIEVTHLFLNVQTNAIGKALIIAFAQICGKEDVKQYLIRGKKIAQKHVDLFTKILTEEDIPAPMSWDSAITDSTKPVFSDKLMMFHVSGMIAAGIGNYGVALAASPRRDLGLRYASLIPEVALYAEDGANIMIKHGWLEEPPMADDRDHLIQS